MSAADLLDELEDLKEKYENLRSDYDDLQEDKDRIMSEMEGTIGLYLLALSFACFVDCIVKSIM